MKSFFISAAFFAFFVFVIIVNCFYVTSTLSNINSSLNALPEIYEGKLPEKAVSDVGRIHQKWNKSIVILSLSINNAELRECTCIIENLYEFSKSGSLADYNSVLAEAKTRINILLERERLSILNVF